MTQQQRITLGLQIFSILIGIALVLQGELMTAFLPFMLGFGGIAWQGRQGRED